MIRVRRVKSSVPFSRKYEIELSPHGWPDMAQRHITGVPNSILESLLGLGDAWSFVREADRQWKKGNQGWAVEFVEESGS